MATTKAKKQQILTELKEKVAKQKATVLLSITGVKVKDLTDLRKRVKAAGGEMKVAKKNLAHLALKENQMEFEKNKHKTEVAFIFGYTDEVSPAKTVYQFSKENDKAQILGGFLGRDSKTKEEVIALAQLPSRDELLAKVVGSIYSPVSGFVTVLQGNIKGLITVLSKIKTV